MTDTTKLRIPIEHLQNAIELLLEHAPDTVTAEGVRILDIRRDRHREQAAAHQAAHQRNQAAALARANR